MHLLLRLTQRELSAVVFSRHVWCVLLFITPKAESNGYVFLRLDSCRPAPRPRKAHRGSGFSTLLFSAACEILFCALCSHKQPECPNTHPTMRSPGCPGVMGMRGKHQLAEVCLCTGMVTPEFRSQRLVDVAPCTCTWGWCWGLGLALHQSCG